MSSNALTVVALFLPLSALWASTSFGAGDSEQRATIANRRRNFFERFHIGSGGSSFVNEKILDSPSSVIVTHISKESTPPSPVKATQTDFYRDLEAQDMAFRGSGEKV